MSKLIELAERCEQVTGPDEALDADICRATKASVEQPDGTWMRYLQGGYEHSIRPLNVTASLDAAMTLVPEGWDFSISREQGLGVAGTYNPAAKVWNDELTAATPTLALCAAALRARASQEAK